MDRSLQNHRAPLKGGLLTAGIALVLGGLGYAFTDTAQVYINIYMLIFCWLLLSVLLTKIPLLKVIGLMVVLIATMALDNHMGIPDNPLTFPLVILFWLGVTYLLIPDFFKKYKIAILTVYGLVLSFFFASRLLPNYAEDHRWKLINAMLIPIPVFAALWGYEQWRWLMTLKAEKAKTELALLKSQINPHFFFNTLNNLYGLAIEKSERTPEVILRLSDMMRYTIYEGKEEAVPLREEIKYLENYIELHKIRYQREVVIRFTHAAAGALMVAPLLFIILLENAFKHGIDKVNENAFLYLHLETTEKQLFFWIENTYVPASANAPVGIGLGNLKKRLTHIYPDRHELHFDITPSAYKVRLNIELP